MKNCPGALSSPQGRRRPAFFLPIEKGVCHAWPWPPSAASSQYLRLLGAARRPAGVLRPSVFKPLSVPSCRAGVIMFGMGLTLKVEDFAAVGRHPWRVLLGVVAHFVIMPAWPWALCQLFHLRRRSPSASSWSAAAPAARPSNVMTWLARATWRCRWPSRAVTTHARAPADPALIWLLASTWLPISFGGLFWSILQVVLLPSPWVWSPSVCSASASAPWSRCCRWPRW